MIEPERLHHLRTLADLVRDRDLSRLRLASLRKTQTETLLGMLNESRSGADLNPVIAAQVVDRFGLWTTNRRILLNQQLARDTVVWMAARSDAQRSFGRAAVLGKLTSKR